MIQCKPVTNGTLTSKNKYYEYRTKTWSNIYFICNNFNFMDRRFSVTRTDLWYTNRSNKYAISLVNLYVNKL